MFPPQNHHRACPATNQRAGVMGASGASWPGGYSILIGGAWGITAELSTRCGSAWSEDVTSRKLSPTRPLPPVVIN
jgi:hypothetical protein